jgi:hypothetical protein
MTPCSGGRGKKVWAASWFHDGPDVLEAEISEPRA